MQRHDRKRENPMRGLMMDMPLLVTNIMRFAQRNFSDVEVVSVTGDIDVHRCTYGDVFRRTRQLANALDRLGIEQGDRIGTLAWNDHRHLELYYATSCSGAVCHTINPRLFDDQIRYIIEHSGDRLIFADPMFTPLLERTLADVDCVQAVVLLTDEAHMPETSLDNVLCYETLLSEENDTYEWPDMDERSASSLCYTSGTTGHPKGVLYDHRSTVLHAYGACLPDVISLSNRDSVLAVVPMFHANAWALPYACPMVGAKLVLPGHLMGDPAALHRLIEEERVTVTLGVPTVWLGLLAYLEKSGGQLDTLERLVVGGAACPESIMKTFSETYNVRVHHSWGMTEMSPVGVFNTPTRGLESLTRDERKAIELKQGRGVFGVEMRVVDDEGAELPWDGEQSGSLQVRGPWVCKSYFRDEGPDEAHGADGWFDTGDVANIDPAGFMQITDRAKDVIKSGGEWISSIDLENTAISHPCVAEAAVIGVAHAKWTERPLLIVVANEGASIGRDEMLHWFDGKVAKWWIPDDVLFVDSLPHTATGKLSKVELRKMYGDHALPNEDQA